MCDPNTEAPFRHVIGVFRDHALSDELTGLMPVVPHGLGGADCAGRIVAVVEGTTVELHCNLCGAVVGVVQVGIMEGLLGLDCGEEESAPAPED